MKTEFTHGQTPMQFDVTKGLDYFGHGIRMYKRSYGSPEKVFLAQPLEMKEYEKGAKADPTMILEEDEAQALMDALWSTGVRPSNGEGNVGQIGAMREHLDDLRADKKFHQGLILNQIGGINDRPSDT